MDITLIQQLSAAILSKLENVTPTQLLSALISLSSMPAHPYEQIKYQLLGPNYKFPTIHEIEIPADYNIEIASQQMSDFSKKINDVQMELLSSCEAKGLGFSENVVLDKELVKKSIIFSELVKTVSMNDIKTKPLEMAQKLTSFYLQN